MITYNFNSMNAQKNFSQILSTIESTFNCLMHTTNPLPSSLTNINGYIGLSCSPYGCIVYIGFYENSNEYNLNNSSNTVIYQSQPLTTIPTQEQVLNAIQNLL